jgi:hypothetical protein
MVRASLKPSPRLAAVLISTHTVAAGTIVPLDIPLAIKAALAIAVAASLVWSLQRHALLRATRSVIALEVRDRLTAAIQGRDHVWRDARVLGTTYVSAALTVLNLRVPGERLPRHVLLVPDNVDEQAFRRIRVLLRWFRSSPEREQADI